MVLYRFLCAGVELCVAFFQKRGWGSVYKQEEEGELQKGERNFGKGKPQPRNQPQHAKQLHQVCGENAIITTTTAIVKKTV